MTQQKRLQTLLFAGVAMLLLLGCSVTGVGLDVVRVGDLSTRSETVERQDAESVRVQVRMGAGELRIGGGAEELMEADFVYNVEDWEPEVSYSVNDSEGRLVVRQPNTDRFSVSGNVRYEWDLRFNEETPLDMRIECGAGDHEIDLTGLHITQLDMTLGAGDAEINASDNPELERLEFDIGAGQAEIDLSGSWTDDVEVDIRGGVGETTLRLPSDIGVRVEISRGIGDTDTSGLSRQDGAWVNEAYGESDVTMEVQIQAGIGRIDLEVRD